MINKSAEMNVFVSVVERGSFSEAARFHGITQSAVSKLISRLESRLGARLINRSTRRHNLTAEGCVFYENAVAILADIDAAERQARDGQSLTGRVRINTSASYAAHILAPILPGFLRDKPGIHIEIDQTDMIVDMMEQRVDIAIRSGPLKSSSLMARRLGESAMRIVASPAYLETHGRPRTVDDLTGHALIGFGYLREMYGWDSLTGDRETGPGTTNHIRLSDGEGVRRFALAGNGLARLAEFTVHRDIAEGRLVDLRLGGVDDPPEPFHAIYVGQGGQMPRRLRACLDYIAQHGRVD